MYLFMCVYIYIYIYICLDRLDPKARKIDPSRLKTAVKGHQTTGAGA